MASGGRVSEPLASQVVSLFLFFIQNSCQIGKTRLRDNYISIFKGLMMPA